VLPQWKRYTEAELIELIDRLIEVKRPRAAFHAAHLDWLHVETSRLKRLLLAVATMGGEPEDHYRLDPYYISEALDSLDGRSGVSPDEMAQLEFYFVEVLDRSKHGIPNLERQVAESPVLFVQALAQIYRRSDGGQDPSEWQVSDPARRSIVAQACYRFLDQIKRIPGSASDERIDAKVLRAWVNEVRRLCVEHGRAEIGDQQIGQLLSKAPTEKDGTWPCLPVCEVLEMTASSEIAAGFSIAVFNSRGVHWRGEDGTQERELAAKYRDFAKRVAHTHPFVSSTLYGIASGYEREAEREDSEAKIRKRLR
jgi:hypothetical protein